MKRELWFGTHVHKIAAICTGAFLFPWLLDFFDLLNSGTLWEILVVHGEEVSLFLILFFGAVCLGSLVHAFVRKDSVYWRNAWRATAIVGGGIATLLCLFVVNSFMHSRS